MPVTMAPLEIDNPFWRFSLRVYGAPGVAQECLEVQDKYAVDVNRLLFAAWIGVTRGVVFDAAILRHIDAAVADWTASAVLPLRAVRRALKQRPDIDTDHVQAFRKQVAAAELKAEQIEQALLYRLADDIRQPAAEPHVAVAQTNLAVLLASYDPEARECPVPSLLAAVAAEGT
jgi:uncharacterized protein (TIGR02444 family)